MNKSSRYSYVFFIQLVGLLFLLSACSTTHQTNYFQDIHLGESEQKVVSPLTVKIRPGDQISILVNSRDPQLTNLFNLPILSQQVGQVSQGSGSSRGLSGYTVDDRGEIDFPVLGKIHVAGKSRSEIAAFIKDALISLLSPAIMLDVVNRLRLDVAYHTDEAFYRKVLYGQDLPVSVLFADLQDNESVSFTLRLLDEENVELSDFIREGEELEETSVMTCKLRELVTTPVGKLTIDPTPYFQGAFAQRIYVSRSGLYGTLSAYSGNLSVALSDEISTVINLSIKDVSVRCAEDILNTLISVYNENWVKDKNQIAISTSMFINDRLGVIEGELGSVDENISTYKGENLLPDVQAASSLYLEVYILQKYPAY
ncbi:polysaccharide biosynthesis/export family protein [Parabacteroides distasonis]|uniref:polysaccharide biosynthesis/export family protein n=1 Tax=Parabacteroides distasonis TaxID=823 RepID=UPI001E6235A2|nr:polysaccharide biosynthesis/export family protein [Parabacteroides distasonis]MDB9152006.1 polysaccharide biosynthesis/export family protein [Parabacteroides distasonis]MDB9156561.1 polysaccharide biosynthesis/export family protein [Parabacteroides distasonis]MDB9165688.1 polysaccharide biosynthesis/export family protein [Parabacteroides distasonis]MDB9170094.1 polysaccharide biosynthesis/export family protein [Parabacteroides distasonis]MDB9193249.1 polysaccharide biosynthesis/export famil